MVGTHVGMYTFTAGETQRWVWDPGRGMAGATEREGNSKQPVIGVSRGSGLGKRTEFLGWGGAG